MLEKHPESIMEKVHNLISELLSEPEKFCARGRANDLLNEYFNGLELATLRPLLLHENSYVRRSASFIASELGSTVEDFVDEIANLIEDPDPHTQWYAIESTMLCSAGRHANFFSHVVKKIESDDDAICRLAMRLVSRASTLQLEAALKWSDKNNHLVHNAGIEMMLKVSELDCGKILKLVESDQPLLRKYGAIICKNLADSHPEIFQSCLRSNCDPLIRKFLEG